MRRASNPVWLLLTALAVDALLILLGTNWIGEPMGDLKFAYQGWANTGSAFGISVNWVYPFLAYAPIWLANTISPGNLILGWLTIWLVFQLAALAVLVFYRVGGESKVRYQAAYFWLAATLALGPVSISRLDEFSVGLAILGMLFVYLQLTKHASVLLTLGLWIKVWPVALISAILVSVKRRLRWFAAFFGASVAMLGVAYLLGGNSSVLSFLSDQTARGIQIESPIAGFWLWPAVLGNHSFGINFNAPLMTFEVFGPNTATIGSVMSLVQVGALAITAALGFLAHRKGAAANEVIYWAAVTGVLDLIVFNKVGSPQYITWLVVPVLFGLLAQLRVGPAPGFVILISLLTWLIYPITYDQILTSDLGATLLLTVRNLCLVAALVYANLRLQKLGK